MATRNRAEGRAAPFCLLNPKVMDARRVGAILRYVLLIDVLFLENTA